MFYNTINILANELIFTQMNVYDGKDNIYIRNDAIKLYLYLRKME